MKRLVSNTKFQSPEGLIYVGPVSDHETWVSPSYGHAIDSYSDEFKEAVAEIVNKMKKERNRQGLDLTCYTNDANKVIEELISPYNHTYFPIELLKYADIFEGEYYIDYTDLYQLIEDHGISPYLKNDTKLIKSSPYYVSEDSDGQLNIVSNQIVLDMAASKGTYIDYVDHNIKYHNAITNEQFTFYPVDKASALEMQKTISQLAWAQDITDYIASQAGVLWSD